MVCIYDAMKLICIFNRTFDRISPGINIETNTAVRIVHFHVSIGEVHSNFNRKRSSIGKYLRLSSVFKDLHLGVCVTVSVTFVVIVRHQRTTEASKF